MTRPFDLGSAWHPLSKPELLNPLAALRITCDCLEGGIAVPAEAAAIVARALRQYLAGHHDITGNLGLRPRRGGANQVPTTQENMERRDQLIKLVNQAQTGSNTARAEKTATLLKSPSDAWTITEADVMAHLECLYREFDGDLPTSGRQIYRLVHGKS